jgi:hypothetical protein
MQTHHTPHTQPHAQRGPEPHAPRGPNPQAPRGPNPHAPASADERRAVSRAYWFGYVWRKVLLSLCVVGAARWVADEGGSFDVLFVVIVFGFAVINGLALLSRAVSAPHEGEGAEHPKVTVARQSLKRTMLIFGVILVVSARLLGGLLVEMSEEVGHAQSASDLTFNPSIPYYTVDSLDVRQDLIFDVRQELVSAQFLGRGGVDVTLTAAVSVEGARADNHRLFLVTQERRQVKGDALLSPEERAPVVKRLLERARRALALHPSLKGQCFSEAPAEVRGEHHALVRQHHAVAEGAPVTFLQREVSQRCVKKPLGSLLIFFALSLSLEIAILLGAMKQRLAVSAARRLHPAHHP